jgi:hypothetical protein
MARDRTRWDYNMAAGRRARTKKINETLYVFEQYKFSPYTVTWNFVFLAHVTYSCNFSFKLDMHIYT